MPTRHAPTRKHPIPLPASGPGALDHFGVPCSCGEVIKSSLPTLAVQWAWDHADFHNSRQVAA